MEDDTPSWLTDSNDPPPPEPTVAPAKNNKFFKGSKQKAADAAPATPAAAPAAPAAPAAELDETSLPQIVMWMRISNVLVAGLTIGLSIYNIWSIPGISEWILNIYTGLAGWLICCLESQLSFCRKLIAINFGFLFSGTFRLLFYLLIAAVCIEHRSIFGVITGSCLAAVAALNTYVICRYPSFRKVHEQVAEEERKRLEARINDQVRKQAISALSSPAP